MYGVDDEWALYDCTIVVFVLDTMTNSSYFTNEHKPHVLRAIDKQKKKKYRVRVDFL